MSRFGNQSFFYYEPGTALAGGVGTYVFLDQSQMPNYPFSEYRISDRIDLRNLNGDLTSFKNYIKAGYILNWTYLDEVCANQLKQMVDADPWIVYWPDSITPLGTFKLSGDPSFEEVQFESYNVEMDLQEA